MDDRNAIIETIYRFANGLDFKDWDAVRRCFMETVNVDYRDLRGEPATTILADDYVKARQSALNKLRTQHLSTNHIVSIDGDTATCRSQMLIYRLHPADFFHTHCYYEHEFKKTASGWKISGIKQKVWWNEGNPDIHSGTKRPDR